MKPFETSFSGINMGTVSHHPNMGAPKARLQYVRYVTQLEPVLVTRY